MFINWFLTIFLCLSILLEVRKVVKELEMEEWERKATFFISTIIFFVAGAILGAYTIAIPIHLYLFWAFILRSIPFWIVSVITAKEPFARTKRLVSKEGEISASRVIALIILIFLLVGVLAFFGPRSISYWQAITFKGMIREFQKGSIELFPEINPAGLRVTTSEIARSIAEIKRTSAESWITSVHLGMYENELSWICTVSEKPTFGMLIGSSNAIREVIAIPVTDATGEKAKVIPFRAFYAEGLWFGNDIKVHGNDVFPLRSFSRGYITSQNGRLVLVTTSYVETFGPLIDLKIHVWDPITGELIGEYTPYDAPEWVVQRWDEEALRIMGDAFGDFRWTAENELNYWNGIPRFSDRSADPSEPEGLRYQMWNGELTAVYLFDNKRNSQVLELVIIATREGIKIYSLDHLGLLSPDDAKELAISGLPDLPEGKIYYTPLALIYRIGSRLFYHIPIYIEIQDQERYYPQYFALVDCQSRSYVRESVEKYGGMTETIKAVYEKVRAPSKEEIIEGEVIDKDEWVENGNTRIWLTLNANGTEINVLVKAELLNPGEMHLLLDKKIGDKIAIKIDKNNVVTKVIS